MLDGALSIQERLYGTGMKGVTEIDVRGEMEMGDGKTTGPGAGDIEPPFAMR